MTRNLQCILPEFKGETGKDARESRYFRTEHAFVLSKNGRKLQTAFVRTNVNKSHHMALEHWSRHYDQHA